MSKTAISKRHNILLQMSETFANTIRLQSKAMKAASSSVR